MDCDGESIQATGWSDETLRKPTPKTTDALLKKLNSDSRKTRLNALKLFSLYSEAFQTEQKYAYQELEPSEQHYCDVVPRELRPLLQDRDADIRAMAALALGFTCRQRKTIDALTYGFKNESDQTAKIYMAWAIARQF